MLASAERYRTLLEINNAIITNLTQDSLLNAICKALEGVLPVLSCRDHPVRSRERHGPHTLDFHTLEYRPFPSWQGGDRADTPSGWVIEHQQPLLCADVETIMDYPIAKRYLEEGIRSFCVAFP